MGTFFGRLIGFSLVAYALLMLFGALLGVGGILIVGILAVGAVFALFACVLNKLAEVEKKLDKLLRETYKESDGE